MYFNRERDLRGGHELYSKGNLTVQARGQEDQNYLVYKNSALITVGFSLITQLIQL